MIYDFDDAIWLPNVSDTNKAFSFMKSYNNVRKLCQWAYKVACGNEYLCNYARQFNDMVVYNPTTIDTEKYHNRVKSHDNDINGFICNNLDDWRIKLKRLLTEGIY